MLTTSLKASLPSDERFNGYKIPGDFDIIGGSLSDGAPSEYMIGIEVKRFRYFYSADKCSWILKGPGSYGRGQARGYSVFGFNKVMLCHFVVAEPIQHPDYNPHLLNAAVIADGIAALRRKKIPIAARDPFGYCIIGWSQVPHKDPLHAGSLPGPDIIKSAPENPLMADMNVQTFRRNLFEQVRGKIKDAACHNNNESMPIILRFQNEADVNKKKTDGGRD